MFKWAWLQGFELNLAPNSPKAREIGLFYAQNIYQAFLADFSTENAELRANILPKSGHTNTEPEGAVNWEWFDEVIFQFVPSVNSTLSPDMPKKLYGFFS